MRIAELYDELVAFKTAIMNEITGVKSEITEMKTQVNDLSSVSVAVANIEKKVDENLAKVYARLDSLEGQSRRSNIILHGVQESPQENWEQTEANFQKVIREKLEIPDDIRVERCHRLGRKRQNGPRPIIAKLSFFKDKPRIFKQAHKLKGSRVSISEDFTKSVRDVRKKLLPHLKKAKENNRSASLSFDKLRIGDKWFIVNSDGQVVNSRNGEQIDDSAGN